MSVITRLKELAGFGAVPGQSNTVPYGSADGQPFITSAKLRKALNNAHRNPVVCLAVNWVIDQSSMTPLILFRLDAEGDSEVVPRDPFLDLLNRPSRFMSGTELRAVGIWDMLTRGQTFWHKDRLRNGRIEGLTFLPAGRMKVVGTSDELVTDYEYRPDSKGTVIHYEPSEIIHIRIKPDPFDPKNGLSPLVCVAKDLLIDDQSGDYASNILDNHGAPGGLLVPDADEGVLTPETAKETRDYIRKNFSGQQRGEIGVLAARMEYLDTNISPNDMSVQTMQNTSVERIAGAIGVHPLILGLGAGAAQSRVGAATEAFEKAAWANRIIPLQDTMAEQIVRQLLPEFIGEETLDDWMLDWDRGEVAVLQPDKLREAQRWSLSFSRGISTRYDAKVAQGLEADDTDRVYFIPSSGQMVPEGFVTPDPPPVPDALDGEGDDNPDDDPEDQDPEDGGDQEAEERARLKEWTLGLFRTKATLNDGQRRLLLRLEESAIELERRMVQDVTAALEDLGDRAVEAFWTVSGVEALLGTGAVTAAVGGRNGTAQVKQEPDPGDVAREAERIAQAMNITQWTQDVAKPAWDSQYLRVLFTTVDDISSTLSVGVNLPDLAARQVVAEGGTNLGLIDFTGEARDALFQELLEGRTNGEGPRELASRIQHRVPAGRFRHAGPEYRARLIARTETKYAQNVSALTAYEGSDSFGAVLVVDAQAGDTDQACEDIDGKRLTFEEAQALGHLEHPNCTRSWTPIFDPEAAAAQAEPPQADPVPDGPAARGFTPDAFDEFTVGRDDFRNLDGFVSADNANNATRRWVSGGNFEVNEKLRKGIPLNSADRELMDGLGEQMRDMGQGRVVFRGMKPDKPLGVKRGDSFDLPHPTSTSLGTETPLQFGGSDTFLELHLSPTTKGIITNDIQQEIIVQSGQRFKSVGVFNDVEVTHPAFGPLKVKNYIVAVAE